MLKLRAVATDLSDASFEAGLDALAERLGMVIVDRARWRRALTHASFAYEHGTPQASYERLEFLGDALLGGAVADVLCARYPTLEPGTLSFLKQVFVRREHLQAWAEREGAASLVRMGKGARRISEAGRARVVSDVAEALLAAIYLDHGWACLRALVGTRLVETVEDVTALRARLEPKSVLQEHLAATGDGVPEYTVESGAQHPFTARVRWSAGTATGCGRTRKEAEQAAARAALQVLSVLPSNACGDA